MGYSPHQIYTARFSQDPPANKFAFDLSSINGSIDKTAVFKIRYLPDEAAWPPDAKAAFQAAVDIWASLITSQIPIHIEAAWESAPSPSILGGSWAKDNFTFPESPLPDTWYPAALANELAHRDLDPNQAEIGATFNRDRTDWYFGTDGNPSPVQYDFETVVLHEIGHGLGFSGSMVVSGDTGSWGYGSEFPFVFDHFSSGSSGQSLVDTSIFPNHSVALADQLQSNDIYFSGTFATAANGGEPPQLYAPIVWMPGSSFYHLDEVAYGFENENSLMTPQLTNGQSIHNPGPVGLGILHDLGWTVNTTLVLPVLPPPYNNAFMRVYLPLAVRTTTP